MELVAVDDAVGLIGEKAALALKRAFALHIHGTARSVGIHVGAIGLAEFDRICGIRGIRRDGGLPAATAAAHAHAIDGHGAILCSHAATAEGSRIPAAIDDLHSRQILYHLGDAALHHVAKCIGGDDVLYRHGVTLVHDCLGRPFAAA